MADERTNIQRSRTQREAAPRTQVLFAEPICSLSIKDAVELILVVRRLSWRILDSTGWTKDY